MNFKTKFFFQKALGDEIVESIGGYVLQADLCLANDDKLQLDNFFSIRESVEFEDYKINEGSLKYQIFKIT